MAAGLVTAILAGHGTAAPVDRSFNVAGGSWSVAGNWSPFGIPGLNDHVRIGDKPIAAGTDVTLAAGATVTSLSVEGSATLYLNGGWLTVTDLLELANPGSALNSGFVIIDGPAQHDVVAERVDINDGGFLSLAGSVMEVHDVLSIDEGGVLTGGGAPVAALLLLQDPGPIGLRNDGLLKSTISTFSIVFDEARPDLDGDTPADSVVEVVDITPLDDLEARLTIVGPGLADDMDGDILLGAASELSMQLNEGWRLTPAGTMHIKGVPGNLVDPDAEVSGGEARIDGLVQFDEHAPSLRVTCALRLGAQGIINMSDNSELTIVGAFAMEGGSLITPNDCFLNCLVRINGATTLTGGALLASSWEEGGTSIQLNGETTYGGALTMSGSVYQEGPATVTSATTIDAEHFEMDGFANETSWTVAAPLDVHAASVHADNGSFQGTCTVQGLATTLEIALDDRGAEWRLGGSLDLVGVFPLTETRLEGSPCRVIDGGTIGATHRVRTTAPLTMESGSTVDFADTSARLRVAGGASIEAGTVFVGGGTLENQSGSTLELGAGLDLLASRLWNAGTLMTGDGPGQVNASSVELQSTSTWRVAIGGSTSGQWDRIGAGNPCTIGGTLDIRLVDLGGGVYEPPLGKSFVILQASGANSVAGTFSTVLPTFVPGKLYQWEVSKSSTQSTTVVAKVASIDLCPGELTGDGVIDGADLAILLGAWGPCPGCNADIDGDGMVDGSDLAILLGGWGPC